MSGVALASIAVVSAGCVVAVVTDLRTRSIPNWLSFGLAGLAFAFTLALGWRVLLASVIVYAIVFAVGMGLFALRVLGGGDVKLLAAVAAFVGFPDAIYFFAYTGIAGGLLAFAWTFVDRRAKLPYAIAILTGFAVLVAAKFWVPHVRLSL